MLLKLFETFEWLKNNSKTGGKKVFIRGAGYRGKILFFELQKLKIKIDGFITPDCDNFADRICHGVPILPPPVVYPLANSATDYMQTKRLFLKQYK